MLLKPTDRKAGCGKTACPVWREGWPSGHPYPYRSFSSTVSRALGPEPSRRSPLPSFCLCGIVWVVNITVTQLTEQLMLSYARVGGINHLDGKNLPSKSAIASITVDLLRLLFPGFFDEKSIHSSELKVEMVSLMDSVLGRLEDEIGKSLEYALPEGLSKKELRPAAGALTLEFLSSLPSVREILRT